MPLRVHAVTVDHNTSHFVELLLRTLFLTNELTGIDVCVSVLDNNSTDVHAAALHAYLAAHHIATQQTGYDAELDPDKHGEVLTQFVLKGSDCSHYLLLDSDAWFVETDTIPTMLRELREAGSSTFAVQAQTYGYYAHRTIEGCGGVLRAHDAVTAEMTPDTMH